MSFKFLTDAYADFYQQNPNQGSLATADQAVVLPGKQDVLIKPPPSTSVVKPALTLAAGIPILDSNVLSSVVAGNSSGVSVQTDPVGVTTGTLTLPGVTVSGSYAKWGAWLLGGVGVLIIIFSLLKSKKK